MNILTSEEILTLVINFENLIKNSNADKLDIKLKVLHLIGREEKTSPSVIIEKLGMARSNLAIMCNKLVKDKLIEKHKDSTNKKEIFYSLTQAGEEFLNETYKKTEENISKLRNKGKINKLVKELAKLI